MKITIDINEEVVDVFKRAKFSEKAYEAQAIEILEFPNEKESDKFSHIWFKGIGFVQQKENRYFLTTLGTILYEQII